MDMKNSLTLLEQLKETEWYKTRPPVIQKAIDMFDPTKLYKIIETGEECRILGYNEMEGQLIEDVTFIIETRSGIVHKNVCRHKIEPIK